jgi:beta-glucosidase
MIARAQGRSRRAFSLAIFATTILAGAAQSADQPVIEARNKPILTIQGQTFKDLNADGRLQPYEDWRLAPEARARDLVGRMTLAEKAGTMLIATNNPECDGSISGRGLELIDKQKMTRFILRAKVTATGADCAVKLTGFALRGGYAQTPLRMAQFTNAVQARLEAGRLGVPALFKDNPRNHVETNPMFGIGAGAGLFTEFPKPAGLAAAALGAAAPVTREGTVPADLKGDLSVLHAFTGVMGEEWKAIGLRGVYGYTADLATEPRWSRVHETFTEDADLMSGIISELVRGLQGPVRADGTSLSPASAVALTVKHFPGGGPQELGLDPHYTFGKNQLYPDRTGRYGFDYHLKPFRAAIAAGASSIMPYYGVPIGLTYEGVRYDELGMAFSRQIVTDLLRGKLGFKGNVNSDSGVIESRGWGLESFRTNPATGRPYSVEDRTAIAIKSGSDVLSEFSSASAITGLVERGLLSERETIDPAVTRLLTEQFQLGLFEDPYVDAEAAATHFGKSNAANLGLDAQRQSVVLLKNSGGLLPLKGGSKVYVMGFKADDVAKLGFAVTDGNAPKRTPVPAGADVVLIKVLVNNDGARRYASNDPATGGRPVDAAFPIMDPRTGKPQSTWGAQDPCVYAPDEKKPDGQAECLDNNLIFGGPFPWEVNALALSDIAKAQSWAMTPSLADIQAAVREVGDPKKVAVSIYFRSPFVLDDASGVKAAGALLATFGVSDAAQLDVIAGRHPPRGRLPFALPSTSKALLEQDPDAPGYAETKDGALYPFGFGLSY